MSDFPFRVVGFDLDGTLVDTAADLTAAVNHALSLIDRSEAVPVQPVVRDPDEAIATLTLPSPEARKSALPASAMPTTPDTAMRSLDDARALLQRLTPSQTQTEVPPHEAP